MYAHYINTKAVKISYIQGPIWENFASRWVMHSNKNQTPLCACFKDYLVPWISKRRLYCIFESCIFFPSNNLHKTTFFYWNFYRLPPLHGPQSPIQSPIYDQLGPYKTLPHVRSHSPFAAGLTLARVPRQGAGYVTIPRRPRQSWSSEPPPSSEMIAEPLYDNLGIRTTADGE